MDVPFLTLLDDGSELNPMANKIYKESKHLIDESIQWRINRSDSKIKEELLCAPCELNHQSFLQLKKHFCHIYISIKLLSNYIIKISLES